jgi:hypothetical protein
MGEGWRRGRGSWGNANAGALICVRIRAPTSLALFVPGLKSLWRPTSEYTTTTSGNGSMHVGIWAAGAGPGEKKGTRGLGQPDE